jgi:xanthine dehydrogenase accessory factor
VLFTDPSPYTIPLLPLPGWRTGGRATMTPVDLEAFLAANSDAILCELTAVRGSSPREQGTLMLVGIDEILGTIGGGALEYMVIEHARRLIASGRAEEVMDVPLGPEIGQCCGGRVEVGLRYASLDLRAGLQEQVAGETAALPRVYVFGAGHVGRVLAQMLALLPVQVQVIDTREEELSLLAPGIPAQCVAMPEAVVRNAPAGSSFVILTHDHALDFLIAQEALARTDAPYVGMVGSRTKRARFSSWYLGEGGDPEALNRLVLPIGANGIGDKRPAVIAALAAAEIMVQIGKWEANDGQAQVSGALGALSGR